MNLLDNKVVMISGSAGLLGSSFARSIKESGGKLALVDINENRGNSLAIELGKSNALYIKADLTKSIQIENAIDETLQYFGRIDSAIHSLYPKSKAWGTKFENLKESFLREDLMNQLGSAILFSKSIIKVFKNQGYGNLIHISSIQGVSSPKFSHYSGTKMTSPIEYSAIKSGIISITKWLAKYYKNSGIRVNCISPGGIRDGQSELFLKKYADSCLSKGMLDPGDINGAMLFLLSNFSEYINGQNIIVDDGWSL